MSSRHRGLWGHEVVVPTPYQERKEELTPKYWVLKDELKLARKSENKSSHLFRNCGSVSFRSRSNVCYHLVQLISWLCKEETVFFRTISPLIFITFLEFLEENMFIFTGKDKICLFLQARTLGMHMRSNLPRVPTKFDKFDEC